MALKECFSIKTATKQTHSFYSNVKSLWEILKTTKQCFLHYLFDSKEMFISLCVAWIVMRKSAFNFNAATFCVSQNS